MTLRHLKIFAVVCQENSISLAAKKLYISQPAVSNTIKELETYYGTPLFDRISRKLYLTQTGNVVYQYAIHITSLFQELEESVKNPLAPGFSLNIGSSITIGTHLMPEYICRFSEQYPDIPVYVTIDSSDVIEHKILNNELDFGLIEGFIHSDHLISHEFVQDELTVICSPENPLIHQEHLTVSALSGQNFLMREKNSGTRELAESILSLHGIFLQPLWESSSTEAIINGVAKNIGISILPLQLVQEPLRQNKIIRLKINDLSFDRQYHIIYHKNKFLSPAALAFMKLCHLPSPISRETS